jgi:hypothetical protein
VKQVSSKGWLPANLNIQPRFGGLSVSGYPAPKKMGSYLLGWITTEQLLAFESGRIGQERVEIQLLFSRERGGR